MSQMTLDNHQGDALPRCRANKPVDAIRVMPGGGRSSTTGQGPRDCQRAPASRNTRGTASPKAQPIRLLLSRPNITPADQFEDDTQNKPIGRRASGEATKGLCPNGDLPPHELHRGGQVVFVDHPHHASAPLMGRAMFQLMPKGDAPAPARPMSLCHPLGDCRAPLQTTGRASGRAAPMQFLPAPTNQSGQVQIATQRTTAGRTQGGMRAKRLVIPTLTVPAHRHN